MAISYNKLWKLLIDKGIKKTELKTLAGVSSNVIAKLGKNDPVSMETLTKICTALNQTHAPSTTSYRYLREVQIT